MTGGGQLVSVERRDDGVAILRIDRPRANALSSEVVHQIAAGADINELTDDAGTLIPAEGAMAISNGFRAAYDAVAAIPRLTVAAVTGYALGGG